jgi:hypothetical protein
MTRHISRGVTISLFAIALALLSPNSAHAQAFAINGNCTPNVNYFGPDRAEVGWFVTPTVSFALGSLGTTFNHRISGDYTQKLVTAVVYTALPTNGGKLLGYGQANVDTNGGPVTFNFTSPVAISSGNTYFIGFENLTNIGVCMTVDDGAVNLDTLYCDSDGKSWDGRQHGIAPPQPILRFYAQK